MGMSDAARQNCCTQGSSNWTGVNTSSNQRVSGNSYLINWCAYVLGVQWVKFTLQPPFKRHLQAVCKRRQGPPWRTFSSSLL